MPIRWRARATTYSAGDADGDWYGKWHSRRKAVAQARRWCEERGNVWVESNSGQVVVLQEEAEDA